MKVQATTANCLIHGECNHLSFEWATQFDANGEPTMWDTDIVCVQCDDINATNIPQQ
jgi:hypothetical protein